MRWRKLLFIIAGVVFAMPVAALGVFIAIFDANDFKPRIEAAVLHATGRALSLRGPLSLRWSLIPTIAARDVAFANNAGGSRPEMVTLARIEAEVALLPLLSNRIEISRLLLRGPDILIETAPDGRGNWVFARPDTAKAQPAAAEGTGEAAGSGRSMDVEVKAVKVEDGTLTWHDGETGRRVALALHSLALLAPSETSPVTLALAATYAGTRFDAKGELGPTARLRDALATTPWPMKLVVSTEGTEITVDGQSATPLQPASFAGKASGRVGNLAQLPGFVVGVTLPPVRDVTFAADVAGEGSLLKRVTGISLRAGESDLAAFAPGLMLTSMEILAPRMDQPFTVQAEGNYANAPMKISATLGAMSALGAGKPFPIDASLAVAGATATAKGTLADPAGGAGTDVAVNARIPALGPFAALVGRKLPDLRDIVLEARVGAAQGGFAKGIAVRQARLTLPQGDISGDASVLFLRPPSITGTVTSRRVDLDGVAAIPWIRPPAPAGQQAAPAGPPPSVPPANLNMVFSDAPIDFSVLRSADADIQLRIAELRTSGQSHRDIAGRFVIKDGRLVLDPISGILPAGRMSGRLTIDASRPIPPVTLALRAPGLSARALALLVGLQTEGTGALEVDADLNGAGGSLRAIAAGLNGTLGLAMVNADIDNRVLNSLLGPILSSASLPLALINPGQVITGRSALRCFAARLDARNGLATVRALYLDSARVKVHGGGTINLADETLALRLEPLARLSYTGITVPLVIGGTLAAPSARIDAAGSLPANVAGLAQSAQNLAEVPLGVISGALGGPQQLSSGGDDCTSQLAIARGRPGGLQPNTPPSLLAVPADAASQILNAPKNVLRNLFGR